MADTSFQLYQPEENPTVGQISENDIKRYKMI